MSDIPPRLTPADKEPRRTLPARSGQTGVWVVLVLLALLIIGVMAYSANMSRAPVAVPADSAETPTEPSGNAGTDAGDGEAVPGVETETAPAQNPPATNP